MGGAGAGAGGGAGRGRLENFKSTPTRIPLSQAALPVSWGLIGDK